MPQSKSEPIEHISAPDRCPDCGIELLREGHKRRAAIDCHPIRMIRKILRLECKRCPRCGKQIQAQTPGVLPKSSYGNQLLAHVAATLKSALDTSIKNPTANIYDLLFPPDSS